MESENEQEIMTFESQIVETMFSLGLCDWNEWMDFHVEPQQNLSNNEIAALCLDEMIKFGLDYNFQIAEFGIIKHPRMRERLSQENQFSNCNGCDTILLPERTGHWRCLECYDYDFCSKCYEAFRRRETQIHSFSHRFVQIATSQEQSSALQHIRNFQHTKVPSQAA